MTDKAHYTSVIFRKYVFQVGIALFTLLFLTVLSLSVTEKATKSYAERERYRDSELNETVFSATPDYEESFYSFNGCAYAYGGGHRLNADVLMTVEGKSYRKNPLYLKSILPEGGCAISENLAQKNGIDVGDVITVKEGINEIPFDFTVSEILPAQSGIDEKYMHEGIIILSENRDFVKAGKYIFISFVKDWGAEYLNLIDDPARGPSVVFTKDIIKAAESRLVVYALLSTVALWVFIAACEALIFAKMGRKYRDYLILGCYGISRGRLFCKVFSDNAIKYLLSLVISFVIWFLRFKMYRFAYFIPALTFLAVGIITAVILTLITVMRKQECQKIKR